MDRRLAIAPDPLQRRTFSGTLRLALVNTALASSLSGRLAANINTAHPSEGSGNVHAFLLSMRSAGGATLSYTGIFCHESNAMNFRGFPVDLAPGNISPATRDGRIFTGAFYKGIVVNIVKFPNRRQRQLAFNPAFLQHLRTF